MVDGLKIQERSEISERKIVNLFITKSHSRGYMRATRAPSRSGGGDCMNSVLKSSMAIKYNAGSREERNFFSFARTFGFNRGEGSSWLQFVSHF